MSKKETSKTAAKTAPKKPSALLTFLRSERCKFIVGLLILLAASVYAFGYVSFICGTGKGDQSVLDNLSGWDLVRPGNGVANWGGAIGALLAELTINRWLGVPVILFDLLLFRLGTRLMRAASVRSLGTIAIRHSLLAIWLSATLGFLFVDAYSSSFLFLGGKHGYTMSLFIQANLGWWGSLLLLVALGIILSVFFFQSTIERVRSGFQLGNLMSDYWKKRQELNADAKQREKELQQQKEREKQEPEDATIPDDTTAPDGGFTIVPGGTDGQPQGTGQDRQCPDFQQHGQADAASSLVSTNPEDTDPEPLDVTGDFDTPAVEGPSGHAPHTTVVSPVTNPATVGPVTPVGPANPVGPATPTDGSFIVKKPSTDVVDEPVVQEELPKTDYDPTKDLEFYQFPGFDLLKEYDNNTPVDMEEQNANKEKIKNTLASYGVEILSITATVGPTITLFEIVPVNGTRISRVRNLSDEIAMSIASTAGIRIIAPIPGKSAIGIEVPNRDPQTVSMRECITSRVFQESKMELPVVLGKTITNEVFTFDLAKAPHLLVAGATGQGKSVGLNAIITSLLYRKHPSQLKIVLVDPKMVEFSIYKRIEKHYLARLADEEDPIITDVSKVVATLQSVCAEMEDRYALVREAGVRNIKEYNEKFIKRELNPKVHVQAPIGSREGTHHHYMPYIVVVVDEYGDLIMTAGKEVELPIARIAQKARAVGIHMIIATQRPSAKIVTGLIKANFPARIAFRVSSSIDSSIILDQPGAQNLIGRGDLLFSTGNVPVRVQCAFVDTPEVDKINRFIAEQQSYPTAHILPEPRPQEGEGGGDGEGSSGPVDLHNLDPLFNDAAELVVSTGQGSTSMIQRKCGIGYARAGRIMDQLEAAGIVGPYTGSKARAVLIDSEMELRNILDGLKQG